MRVEVMWFLIKASFWFSVVLIALPFFDGGTEKTLQGAPQVEAVDTVLAAAGAINYMTKICEDRPLVCEKGGETLNALGYRAREGARIAYRLIDKGLDNQDNRSTDRLADPITTGAIVPIPVARPDR